MKFIRFVLYPLAVMSVIALQSQSSVIINEIHYDPIDYEFEAGSLREFIELYNDGTDSVDLSGYALTDGVEFIFPNDIILDPGDYLVVTKTPTHRFWRNKSYPVLGPFEGKLDNDGEWIRLTDASGTIIEMLHYGSKPPWPRGADGYGPSLERISADVPAYEYQNWRASLNEDGTPGAINTVVGTPINPLIHWQKITPAHPRSDEAVTVDLELDSPDAIESVVLHWESNSDSGRQSNALVAANDQWAYKKGTSAPSTGLQWTEPDFDDSAWSNGRGGFGYGDTEQVNLLLNDMRSNYTTFFIRHTFEVNDPAELGELLLSIYFDDGFIAYLNGEEVARDFAPTTYTFRSTSNGNHEATDAEVYNIGNATDLLTPGNNTLAVVGFNTSLSGSSDFVLAPTLLHAEHPDDFQAPMEVISLSQNVGLYRATIPPFPNQTLIRYNFKITLTDGSTLTLPHVAEPRPYESYFVYDDDIPSVLPIMWLLPEQRTNLPSRSGTYSAAVVKPLGDEPIQVFDGVRYTNSRNGNKVKFLKGEEFRGDRTINLSLEAPIEGTTAGPQSPHVEQISYDLFRDYGVLTPRCDWYRVIENGKHHQRIAVQQPNERFLEMNGRDPDGNVYKIAYNEPGGYSKKTNLDEGDEDYRELFQNVRVGHPRLKANIERYLVYEEIMGYEVATFVLSHWDGFKNNIFLYHDPAPDGKWEIIPWDTDKTFGYTDSDPMYYEMPIDFSITLRAPGSPELTGRNLDAPIGRPIHMIPEFHEDFVNRVRHAISSNGLFSLNRMGSIINNTEAMLLEDLDMIESYTNGSNSTRRNNITNSYDVMRYFLEQRHAFLRTQLPAGFSIQRVLPSRDYSAGKPIENIAIQFQPLEETAFDATITETIPQNFEILDLETSHGNATFSGNTITWVLDTVNEDAQLTYSLQTPESMPIQTPVLQGTAEVDGVPYPISDDVLNYIPADVTPLQSPWVTGLGTWWISDNTLICIAEDGNDPKHAWVDIDIPHGNYTVKADVRMLNWQDHDLARGGVAVRINPDDQHHGLNLLFHDDLSSIDMLNDHVAWGTNSEYSWEVGNWYTMTLTAHNDLLSGEIFLANTFITPHEVQWQDFRHQMRSPGFPGLTGSSLTGLTTQFDNFEVIVDGEVVFSDDFNVDTTVDAWMMY